MRVASLIAFAFSGLLLAGPTVAREPADATYLLSMQVHEGAGLIASPHLQIRAGEPARIEIGRADGSIFKMRITVTRQSPATVAVASSIETVSATGTRHSVEPAMTVALGQSSAIAFGEDSATSKPFRVDFTVAETAAD